MSGLEFDFQSYSGSNDSHPMVEFFIYMYNLLVFIFYKLHSFMRAAMYIQGPKI